MPAPALADLSPMLLTERKTIPTAGDWLYEIKYDGYRLLAATGDPQLRSRNGHVATRWFPEIAEAMATLAPGCILDGEVCVLDELGRPDFDRLHRRAARRGRPAGSDPVAYSVFDVLVLDGEDIRDQPVENRKAALREVLDCCASMLLYVQDVDDGQGLYQHALALGLEGIVGKRLGSAYQCGKRSRDWVKVKRPGAVPPERFRR